MSSPELNSPVSSTSSRGALILVVERNSLVQRLERYFLEQAGFNVEFTGDGIATLARAQELRIIKTRGSSHDNRELAWKLPGKIS